MVCRLACLLILLFHSYSSLALNPVVLVPGLGGSQIEAKLNKTNSSHFYCSKHSDWYTIWLGIFQLGIEDCMVENLQLSISDTDGTTKNQEGVELRAPRFGDTDSVEWLDPAHPYGTQYHFAYFVKIVDRLKEMSYLKNVSIRGAPYDFRKAPNEMGEFLSNLTELIEETYEINNFTRVVLIGHSMGNVNILYLLNHKTSEWKDKYIEAFISIAAPWGGAVKSLRMIASGDSLGLSTLFLSALKFRPLQQSMPSSAWLMPSDSLWNEYESLVLSPSRNYTVNDYEDFFRDINFPKGILLRKNTEPLVKKLESPGVKTFCLYGLNVGTPVMFDYRNSKKTPWYDNQPERINGPGDGTVNEKSLKACKNWPNTTIMEFDQAEHLHILTDVRVIDYI